MCYLICKEQVFSEFGHVQNRFDAFICLNMKYYFFTSGNLAPFENTRSEDCCPVVLSFFVLYKINKNLDDGQRRKVGFDFGRRPSDLRTFGAVIAGSSACHSRIFGKDDEDQFEFVKDW